MSQIFEIDLLPTIQIENLDAGSIGEIARHLAYQQGITCTIDWVRGAIVLSKTRWARVNDDPFEYAITQGKQGDEFVKMRDGQCLRRPWGAPTAIGLNS